jgi:YVTN family beta-propeller protein
MYEYSETVRMPPVRRIVKILAFTLMLAVILFLLSGCAAGIRKVRPPLVSEGELLLYLAPLSQEAAPLEFTLAEVSALRDDGSVFPLSIKTTTPTNAPRQRQRLLARGILPPGIYRGLTFRLGKATIETEEGRIDLLVAKEGETAPLRFEVKNRGAVVLESTFLAGKARADGFSLRALFSLATAISPLPSLTGYMTIPDANHVVVFDKENGKVGRIIPTGMTPSGVVFDREGKRAYISLAGEDSVMVVDMANHEPIHQIRLYPGDQPRDLAFTPDGKTLLVVNESSNTVAFLDPGRLSEISRIPVGNRPVGITIDRSGQRAYIPNLLSSSVSVIDIPSRQVIAAIRTESEPYRCQLNRQGNRLLVGHRRSPNFIVYDTLTRARLLGLNVPGGVSAIKVDPQNDQIYVASQLGGAIEIYTLPSSLPSNYISASPVVEQMIIDGTGNTLLTLQPTDNSLRIVNLVSKNERLVVEVDESPLRVTVAGER